ncbi:MAG: F0F1 ATP synthase subunit epsilon [Candidatus Cloacimonetes bacterium]|jgi:F-type H+-transporting ATPase subunit epsilon|nr:F0F1 ATP synthase subunit epsilon [Candidatus Cloacimonadota bacterium]MDY0171422.1 hypothetical protein [Candidatus Cloacimonadaceae bacterium]
MAKDLIKLRILLPTEIALAADDISSLTIETSMGSMGIQPRRRDCVAIITPGILVMKNSGAEETFVAIDEGILTKTGLKVTILAHNAISGKDLSQLKDEVKSKFLHQDDEETNLSQLMHKIEDSLLSRLHRMN